jgi:hypothetical protein
VYATDKTGSSSDDWIYSQLITNSFIITLISLVYTSLQSPVAHTLGFSLSTSRLLATDVDCVDNQPFLPLKISAINCWSVRCRDICVVTEPLPSYHQFPIVPVARLPCLQNCWEQSVAWHWIFPAWGNSASQTCHNTYIHTDINVYIDVSILLHSLINCLAFLMSVNMQCCFSSSSLSFTICFGLMRPSSGVQPLTEPAALLTRNECKNGITVRNRFKRAHSDNIFFSDCVYNFL